MLKPFTPAGFDFRAWAPGGRLLAYHWASDSFTVFNADMVAESFGHRTLAAAIDEAFDAEKASEGPSMEDWIGEHA